MPSSVECGPSPRSAPPATRMVSQAPNPTVNANTIHLNPDETSSVVSDRSRRDNKIPAPNSSTYWPKSRSGKLRTVGGRASRIASVIVAMISAKRISVPVSRVCSAFVSFGKLPYTRRNTANATEKISNARQNQSGPFSWRNCPLRICFIHSLANDVCFLEVQNEPRSIPLLARE
jgi:hypothetical protein